MIFDGKKVFHKLKPGSLAIFEWQKGVELVGHCKFRVWLMPTVCRCDRIFSRTAHRACLSQLRLAPSAVEVGNSTLDCSGFPTIVATITIVLLMMIPGGTLEICGIPGDQGSSKVGPGQHSQEVPWE